MNRHQTIRSRSWIAALAVAAVVTPGYFALPKGAVQDLGYNAIGVVSVVAIAVGVRLHRPADRATWLLFALGNLCAVLGAVVSTGYTLLNRDLPTPSIADGLHLASYPLLFGAVLRLGRRSTAGESRERRTDAAIVSLGALALSWHLLMGPYAHDATVSTVGKLTHMAYPVMDIGVLFIVVNAILFGNAREVVDKLVGAAMAVMLIGDFIYDLLELHGAHASGGPVDATWLVSYLLIGVAALHPSMARASTRTPVIPTVRRLNWMPVAAVAGFVSPTLLLGGRADVGLLAATSLVLSGFVTVRMSWMFKRMQDQTEQLHHRTESLQQALLARDNLAADLHHQAFHDALTGLANRALLTDRIEHALTMSARGSGTVALILCDLDGFKTVNDSLGHQAGDSLLIASAEHMASVVRPGDTVARLGGDEFAVLMNNVEDPADADTVADRIISALRSPMMVDAGSVSLTASAGLTFGSPAKTTEQMLSEADAAMYEAKARGKNRYQVFEPPMRSRIIERLQLTNSFDGALARSEFYLEFQPYFSLGDERLQGFEALVRWQHPTLGLVAPGRFISLAEETGFIVPLGRWVLDAACQAAKSWPTTSGLQPTVAVNLSARQLQDRNLVSDIRTALAFSGLPGERLVLEITESMLVADPEQTVDILGQVHRMGVTVAIDDFGTGYSSLGHLRQFPVDILKIDKSFVEQLDGVPGDGRAFVEAIVRLAHDLDLVAVAEGIEAKAQRDALIGMGCDSGQGFLLSRPLDARDAAELVWRAGAGATVTRLADRQLEGQRDTG